MFGRTFIQFLTIAVCREPGLSVRNRTFLDGIRDECIDANVNNTFYVLTSKRKKKEEKRTVLQEKTGKNCRVVAPTLTKPLGG